MFLDAFVLFRACSQAAEKISVSPIKTKWSVSSLSIKCIKRKHHPVCT